jgi:hypothetical protein
MKYDLWKKYCRFYEKSFFEQIEYSKNRMDLYFQRWRKLPIAKLFCNNTPKSLQEVPITTYQDYFMLHDFGESLSNLTSREPRRSGEFLKNYYERITKSVGSSLSQYMCEPYYLCMKTTGTTGKSKWVVQGETYWKNFSLGSIATSIISCSNSWGETTLNRGDKVLNMNAPIPFVSGWGTWAAKDLFRMIPPIDVADNVKDMREKFSLILEAIRRKERIVVGGGIGSLFYMICNYFVEPQKFFSQYYPSMNFGLKKMLLFFKLFQLKIRKKERKSILDFLPLKGVLIAGMESRLYLDFFKKEFNLEPLHIYGSTEAGTLMRGDPDRKSDLIPDLRTCYLEFKTKKGEIKSLDQLKKGEVYQVIVTPIGSILFRYDLEDLLKVIDFRDDGMPVFEFEGRKKMILRLYSWYRVTPSIVVKALSLSGLHDSDKWAVAKVLKPKEHLHFLMEKTWSYSESEAEKFIYENLLKVSKSYTGRTLSDYATDFRISKPSELVKVEYLKPGAFLRYSAIKAKQGSPLGQYKPPKMIPPERMEIYETLRNA